MPETVAHHGVHSDDGQLTNSFSSVPTYCIIVYCLLF